LNIFQTAVENKIKRVVFAASSSTYGDSENLPKVEQIIGKPLSPYAVTKYVNELYADVFSKTYEFEYIGLRYFNIFGPKQDPNGAYAAVIPLFMKAALENESPLINGDGTYSRDFTYIDNAVQANILSLFVRSTNSQINKFASSPNNQIYNVACGDRTTLNQLWKYIKELTGTSADVIHRENRVGDIPHSLANIEKAKSLLEYNPSFDVKTGLHQASDWYKENLDIKQKI
jgi:UDP-N-acetylglucosamine/UDP-N-acetyl-alpha-D-glucosaminouronate 4-epimerase